MQIILDTNFILTCIKQEIRLFEQLRDAYPGTRIVVPEQVIAELGSLSKDKRLKGSERESADLCLQIIGNENVIVLDLPEEKADDAIVNYVKKNDGIIVASLDRGIKKRLKNKKFLTIKQKKRIVPE